jgi:hypothetical protein
MPRRRLLFACACLVATTFAPDGHAQTSSSSSGGSTTGTDSINSPLPNPSRYLLGVNQTNNPRPQNLNPTGCNYLDCAQDLELQFSLIYSGFSADHIEVWAGTVDCTQDVNRTGTGVSHLCWQVAGFTGPLYATSAVNTQINVFARDVLRYENPGLTVQPYQPSFHSSSDGPSACKVQLSDAEVDVSIYFIPVNSTENAVGTAYSWPFKGDLVAPPAPLNVTLSPGDTLLKLNWESPGNDPDLVGFSIYSDPPAGGATTGGCSCGNAPGSGANSFAGGDASSTVSDAAVAQCMDAQSDSVTSEDGAAADAEGDTSTLADSDLDVAMSEASFPEASTEAGVTADSGGKGGGVDSGSSSGSGSGSGSSSGTVGDAGMTKCIPTNMGGGGLCASFALTSGGFTIGSGTTTTTTGDASSDAFVPVSTGDDSSVSTGAEGGVTLAGGGIASIDPHYKAAEIDDKTATQITLTGLTNGLNYVVVVSSIDGSGNVGPVSTTTCLQPEPTDDYWKTYKKDGGTASGCALGGGTGAPVFAMGIAAAAAALARRRRRP